MSSEPSVPSVAASKGNAATTATATAAARRAKKREQDRRCQRMLRERTKNRIAYLENLLEQQGTSAQLQTLLKERDEAVADRDRLIQALRTINRVVKTSHPLLTATASYESPGRDLAPNQGQTPQEDTSPAGDAASVAATGGFVTDTPMSSSHVPDDFSDAAWLAGALEEITGAGAGDLFMPDSTLVPMASFNLPPQQFLGPKSDYQSSSTSEPCECAPPRPSDSETRPLNMWRFASETLAEPIPWSSEISEIEDALAEDIPVRAIAESWDAAAQSLGGALPPSWQQLRRIDETLFASLGDTERLAIMRTMHSLLVSHADTTLERRSRLPDWYIARPSQTIAHSAATDYFTWPGVRERFVFHPHRYCANRFWTTFNKSFRLLWPFEFRDCYTRSTQTGRYNVSPTFQERISDLRAFTMGEEMFQLWPEFRSDIPAFESMSMSLSPSWASVAADTAAAAWGRHMAGSEGDPIGLWREGLMRKRLPEDQECTRDTGSRFILKETVDSPAQASTGLFLGGWGRRSNEIKTYRTSK
ncbi:hypothetical protein Micbo1qcDRAFT_208174 [Microdochium bolleyi]|uniref:BZIP domain-containing protein n=1 Tax=Microdochium bolleyi TaxID=196109 RepID=A0A136IS24_9PEZI|nr:hypothetical protein Micbo1qcDRAFT_208174 [Microdochium bolleyi]